MKHYRGRAALIVAMTAMLTVTLVAPASAGVPSGEPYSCTDSADGHSWGDNCWVSTYQSDPDRVSDFTTGVQTIVRYEFWLGSIDGWYGSLSKNAVKQYQSSRGLSVDGIVGTNTWNGLKTELVRIGIVGSWDYYRHWSTTSNIEFRKQPSGDQFWQVSSVLTQTWEWMDRSRST